MTTLIELLSTDISVAFALSITMVAILIMATITQVMQSGYEDTISDMEETIFSLHCDISDMAHDEMANHHYHQMDIIKLNDEINELKLQLKDAKLVADYLPNYYEPLTEEDVNELAKIEL